MREFRTARVSAVQKDTGMVSVIYLDQEDSATDYLPCLTHGEEYNLPKVEDVVLVAGLSGGAYSAVVLGTFWSRAKLPPCQDGPWAKNLTDDVSMEVNDDVLTVRASDLVLETKGRRISLLEMAGD